MDEVQRRPAETYVALASHHKTVVAVGDRGQQLAPPMRARVAQWGQRTLLDSTPPFALDLLLERDRLESARLEREPAAPGAPDSPFIHHLSATKRFGNPLAQYLAFAYPGLCRNLCAALQKETTVTHVWYETNCARWYNLGHFTGARQGLKRPFPATRADDSWQLSAAVWHDGLSTCLAALVLNLLRREVASRGPAPVFHVGEMVVAVCSAIRRVVGPFQLVMDKLLANPEVLQAFELTGIRPEHVQVRLPSELTGPSAAYAIVVRHPRNRLDNQAAWTREDLNDDGHQRISELNYIMESRPEKGLYVFMHARPPDDSEPRSAGTRRARGDRHPKEILEGVVGLLIARSFVNCEAPAARCPFQGIGFGAWQSACSAARHYVSETAEHAMSDIVHASRLVGEGDGNIQDNSVLDSMRSLSTASLVTGTQQEAKQHGEARWEAAPPLGDLGRRTWPRGLAGVYNEDWTAQLLSDVMEELAWRLVDHVAVQIQGKTASQIAVPMLDPLPGFTSPGYGTAQQAAPGAPSLLAGFVMCVWAMYEAHRDPENGPPALAMMGVHHKASVHEGSGGLTWWSRACATDREAIILLNVKDADLLTKDRQSQHHPRKPRNPPLYCYIGGGVDRQPECITSIVVRTKDAALTAAVVTVCRVLGKAFGNSGDPPAEGWDLDARLFDPGEFHEESAALLERLEAMWTLSWAPLDPRAAPAELRRAVLAKPGWKAPALPPAAVAAAGVAARGGEDEEPMADWDCTDED